MTDSAGQAAGVALVTGAGSGLGRATALRLAADGAAVACLDLNPAAVAETAIAIMSLGGAALAVEADVSSASAVAGAVERVLGWRSRLDILVNAAGIASIAHTRDVTEEQWNALLAVNLTGTFLLCQHALPHLLARGGNVVNVSSTAGISGWRYMAAYAATKGGIIALTKSLAAEYAAAGVRVNCVAPGSIDTPLAQALSPPKDADPDLLQRGRALVDPPRSTPEEVAGAIAYLASPAARFVTGTVLVIDGGASL